MRLGRRNIGVDLSALANASKSSKASAATLTRHSPAYMHWSWRPKNASSAPLTTRPNVGAARTGSRSAAVKTFSGTPAAHCGVQYPKWVISGHHRVPSSRATILNLIYVKYSCCNAKPNWVSVVTPMAAFINIGQDVLKETTNGSGSQSAAEGSACNTYRPQAECRT